MQSSILQSADDLRHFHLFQYSLSGLLENMQLAFLSVLGKLLFILIHKRGEKYFLHKQNKVTAVSDLSFKNIYLLFLC